MRKCYKTGRIILEKSPLIIFIISIILIYLIKFCFNDIPEKWEYGYEMGEIIYNLNLAYISSFIFYILIVLIPEKRKKKNIYQHIKPMNDSIFYIGSRIIYGINDIKDNKKLDDEVSEYDFLEICNKIGPNDIQDFFLTPKESYSITYINHINESRLRIKKIIESIFVYIPFLESEHIKVLNDILNSQLLTSLDTYCKEEEYHKNQKSFESISYALYDFYKKTRLLKKYNDKIKI